MFFSLHPLSVKMAGVFCFTRHRNDAMFFIAISMHSSLSFRCTLHRHFGALFIVISMHSSSSFRCALHLHFDALFIVISMHSSLSFRYIFHLHFDAFSISISFVGMLFPGLKRGDACGEWCRMDESLSCLFFLCYFFSQCSVSQARTGVS